MPGSAAPPRETYRPVRSRLPLPPGPLAGFGIAILAVLVIAALSFVSLQNAGRTAERVTHTFQVLDELRDLLSTVKDAETSQRGFLLTGTETYLEPYTGATFALPRVFGNVETLVADSEPQRRRLDNLRRFTDDKMQELGETIELKRAGKDAEALALVRTDRGKESMDQIRAIIAEMQNVERQLLTERQADSQNASRIALIVTWGGSALLLFLIVASAVMTSRDFRARETQVWLRTGQMGLSLQVQGEQRLDQLGDKVLSYLARFLDAQVGALYIADAPDHFRRVASYAVAGGDNDFVRPGDGVLGQAVKEIRAIRVREVPDDYLNVASGVGRGKPKELLIAPAEVDGDVNAVLELGFFRELTAADLELLERVSESLGVAVRASKDRSRLEDLLEETQRQGEELQTQQEELRVTNEELEVQTRSLQESQVRLEHQQAELEQINSQLEEQAQMLEHQRDELSRTETIAVDRATALEKSNQYKSEFLANMSHELRTPLNSTLILARILADNKVGNLSDEQVKYAETISSAGNDLLALINDILDLSKIESGKVDVITESLVVERTVDTLVNSLQPLANEKGLQLKLSISPGVPERMETDSQRLVQILRNLLSNAMKFTSNGEVVLTVRAAVGDTIAFSVRDTGIGIDASQQEIIFEAFRQADGSTHRKYGGTGLGLSISRDLARLLGGDIAVQSTLGVGSEFTLTLPLVYRPGNETQVAPDASPRPKSVPLERKNSRVNAAGATLEPHVLSPATLADDRDHLSTGSRVLLVVEDDTRFAIILRDMAHGMGFKCVVTQSANDGLAAAATLVPDAILLDMQLPDHSGLGVLDQLKRNPRTRHIPVHVISVSDLSQEALELGAVGYALKPVKHEQLVEAFSRLEAKLVQGIRRVLVIEDDERQRSSIEELLSDTDVEITGVRSAGDALRKLQETTFDCVVMDLNLPDLSGYELLKSMAEQEDVSFPPVIIYTGRSLTRDEELQLRKFSRSIIIKDARSPERLLDEVTLFLHRVESKLPPERQRMLKVARDRDATLEGRRVLIVEDDVRNVFALSTVLESRGAKIDIARNGREAIDAMVRSKAKPDATIDLILMDIMMPEMDGFTAMREIRNRPDWTKVPIIALTAKAMKDDQEKCLAAGANDYIAKPLDVEKLLSLIRVWMPK